MQYHQELARRSVSAGVAAVVLPDPDRRGCGRGPSGRFRYRTVGRKRICGAPECRVCEGGVQTSRAVGPRGSDAEDLAGRRAPSSRWAGIETGWLAMLRLADSTVQFDDGVDVAHRAKTGPPATVPFESVDECPMPFVVAADPRREPGAGGVARVRAITEAMPAIVMSQADFRKYSAASGTYRGRFLVDLDRVEIASVLPLRPAPNIAMPRRRVVIDQIVPQAQTPSPPVASIHDGDDVRRRGPADSSRSICETAKPPTP